eukprot:3849269-Pleurochrysis_carterae.AAC.5
MSGARSRWAKACGRASRELARRPNDAEPTAAASADATSIDASCRSPSTCASHAAKPLSSDEWSASTATG